MFSCEQTTAVDADETNDHALATMRRRRVPMQVNQLASAKPPARCGMTTCGSTFPRASRVRLRRVAFGLRAGRSLILQDPAFLIGQTVIVAIGSCSTSWASRASTSTPFILLNRLQPAGGLCRPLTLLAQTRQADRDKAHADADAMHREALSAASLERQELAARKRLASATCSGRTRLTKRRRS
jgi:hypothetical protein